VVVFVLFCDSFDKNNNIGGLCSLSVASNYGQRSRGRQFLLTGLLETNNLAFQPFTLEPKVKSPMPSKMPKW